MQLNQQQKDAAKASLTGIHLIEALAGSGKTTLLRHRVKYLLRTRPEHDTKVLVMAFNKDVKQDLHERLQEDLTATEFTRVKVGTFHGIALGMVRSYCKEFFPNINPKITPVEHPKDITTITKDWLHKNKCTIKEHQINVLVGIHDEATCLNVSIQDIFKLRPTLTTELKMDYVKAQTCIDLMIKFRQTEGYMFFCDMLPMANKLPDYCFKKEAYVDVLVDELQDLNYQQRAFISRFIPHSQQFTGVGDPRQSIYSFQGCDPDIFSKLAIQYPGSKVYPLTTNYRCTDQILDLANKVLLNELNSSDLLVGTGKQGDLPSAHLGANGLVDWIKSNYAAGRAYSDQAVLYRARSHMPDLEIALSNAGIPYQVEGNNFFDTPVVMDLIKYFYLLYHPKIRYDQWRDITKHFAGFNADAAEYVWNKTKGNPLSYATAVKPPSFQYTNSWANYVSLMSEYKQAIGDPPALAKKISGNLYNRWAFVYGDNPDAYKFFKETAEAFIDWTYKYGADGYQILQTVELLKQNVTKDEDCVKIITVHKSKGREWPCVAVWSLKDGLFPHAKADLAEEHRLLYVAVTRAQEKLALIGLDQSDMGSTLLKYINHDH